MRLATVLFVALLFLEAAFSQNPTPLISVKDLPQYGLKLVLATDPHEQERFKVAVGGEVDTAIESVKRFSVLLENQSDTDLIAYSLRYSGIDADGNPTPVYTNFHHSLETGTTQLLIPAGGVGFVSPEFVIIGHARPSKGSILARPDRVARLSRMATLTICLDAAIFTDGRFVGPDESHEFERAVSLSRGQKAVMEEVLSRHASGESDEALLQWLQTFSKGDDSKVKDRQESFVQMRRRLAAGAFLTTYRKLGSKSAFDMASSLANQSTLAITRVPFEIK